MARSRNIKPGLFKNEILGVADPLYTLLFEGLWVLADRAGRLEDRPLRIKAEIFPYREGLDMVAMLGWLQEHGFILRYVVDGRALIHICEFSKHQNPHKNEVQSELPGPPGFDSEEIGANTEKIGTTRADSGFLIPDSLIPDCVCETPAHTQAVHNFREAMKSRPDLDPDTVFQAWRAHYPPDKRTWDKWLKWIAREHAPVARPPSTADPNSRAAIEALGLSLGLGKWDELKERWPQYMARVKGQPA